MAATVPDRADRRRARTATLRRGSAVGRYLLLDELGAGGMGVVWAAYDPELHRRVALKLLPPRAGASPGSDARIVREAQALAQLSHPNVVAVYDVGTYADGVFLAMELIDGDTLATWMQAAKRTWQECVAVFAAAGRGLAAAHAAGLVHRDFKPSNVLVGHDGRVRVLDFGIARAARDSDVTIEPPNQPSRDALREQLTQPGSVVGTPQFMPPEAMRGDVVGPEGDQFSFCVALYQALFGELPFGVRESGDELPEPRPPPTDTRVPAWLQRAVIRGLELRPAYRYPSMDALIGAITDDPAVRRRRVLVRIGVAAGVAVLVAGALGWRAHVRAEQLQDDPCANSAPLAGVWDAGERERLHALFRTKAGSEGEAEFVATASALDEATRALIGARAKTCARTRSEHAQPESVLLVRLECLDGLRDELAQVMALFEEAGARGLYEAAHAIRRVPGPAACTEARSLVARDVPPPALAPAVAALRQRLAHAWALDRLARPSDAAAEVRPLLADARRLGYRPLVADIALELCSTLDATDQLTLVFDACNDAEVLAIDARLDTDAARAAAVRANAGAVAGKDAAVERQWIAEAAAWTSRIGDLRSEFELEEARAMTAPNNDETIAHHQHAIVLADQLYGPASDLAMGTRGNLAFALTMANRYDDAIAIQERAIATLERAYTGGSDILALLLDNYGYNLFRVGRLTDARAALERALAMRHASQFALGGTHCDLARVDLAQGHIDAAIANGEHGIAILRAIGLAKLNLAVNEDALAGAYLAAKRFEDARALAQECVSEIIGDGKDRMEMVPCLAIEGTALVHLGPAGDGAALLERALRLLAGQPAARGVLGDLQFQLARALVASNGDRKRAAELATAARTDLARCPWAQTEVAELDEWRLMLP